MNFLIGTSCRGCVSFCNTLCLEWVNNGPKAANNEGVELCNILPGCGKRPNAYFMMQSFSMTEMQSSSVKVLHHESGLPMASLSGSTPPLMACKWRNGRKPWPASLTEVVSHGPSL